MFVGQIFLDVGDGRLPQIGFEMDRVLDLENPSALSGSPWELCNKRELEIFKDLLVVKMIIKPGFWVRQSQHIEKSGLLDLFIGVEAGFKARKKSFPKSAQELGVVPRRVQNHGCVQNEIFLLIRVVAEIRPHPERDHFRHPPKPASKGYIKGRVFKLCAEVAQRKMLHALLISPVTLFKEKKRRMSIGFQFFHDLGMERANFTGRSRKGRPLTYRGLYQEAPRDQGSATFRLP
jgi:hypothetical protein